MMLMEMEKNKLENDGIAAPSDLPAAVEALRPVTAQNLDSTLANLESRPPTKMALTILLSPAIQAKLDSATKDSAWTVESLLEHLISDGLHSAYPTVTYRGVELAPAGTFRSIDGKNFRPALGFRTSTGNYRISVRPENPDFERFRKTYQVQGAADPDFEASKMCLSQLRSYLEDCSEEKKIIYPDDFLVQQMVEQASPQS